MCGCGTGIKALVRNGSDGEEIRNYMSAYLKVRTQQYEAKLGKESYFDEGESSREGTGKIDLRMKPGGNWVVGGKIGPCTEQKDLCPDPLDSRS